jgi:outer membrane protein TolC
MPLTVEQSVERALTEGLEMEEAEAAAEAARAGLRGARALYGPRVMVDANAMYFNRKPTFELDLGAGDLPPAMAQMTNQLFPSGPMEAGEQYMVDFRVTVAQPLTKLEAIRELNQIKRLAVDIASVNTDKTAAELAYQVRESAYQLLKLRDTVAVLEETLHEVDARETQVAAYRKAELVGPEQLLEVRVKRSELLQQLAQVKAYRGVAASRLNVLLRLDLEVTVILDEPALPDELPDLAHCRKQARRHRPELAELRLRVQQADIAVRAKIQGFVPDVSLIATYQYQAGTSFGQPELALGAVMSWTPFAWGETYHAVQGARADARQVRLALERVESLLMVDVERAHAEAQAARVTITHAEAGLEQAVELYRIERARFDVRDNTATDLLAAGAAKMRAETAVKAARYDFLIALAGLRKAMGQR